MKRTKILFWVFTGLLVPGIGIGAASEVLGNAKSIEIITRLGYPAYLSPFLGIARILALIAIVVPPWPRLKEWAYAGLVFDVTGAIYSITASGRPVTDIIIPIITLAVIISSYLLHLKRHRIATEGRYAFSAQHSAASAS